MHCVQRAQKKCCFGCWWLCHSNVEYCIISYYLTLANISRKKRIILWVRATSWTALGSKASKGGKLLSCRNESSDSDGTSVCSSSATLQRVTSDTHASTNSRVAGNKFSWFASWWKPFSLRNLLISSSVARCRYADNTCYKEHKNQIVYTFNNNQNSEMVKEPTTC